MSKKEKKRELMGTDNNVATGCGAGGRFVEEGVEGMDKWWLKKNTKK